MADNDDWETPMTKGQKKDAKKAAAAEKVKRDETIQEMKKLVQSIFDMGSPIQYQEVKLTTIAALKAMGENVSRYERNEEDRLARNRAAAVKAERAARRAAQLNVNRRKVEKYYTNKHGRHFDAHLQRNKNITISRLSTRWMGQDFVPNEANIFAELAKGVNREMAANKRREEANAQAHREWRASMAREYPDWYNRGTAAQGGPAPRPAPKANNWQQRAARGDYQEWRPAGEATVGQAPEMYEILGIPVNSSIKNIKKAYKAMALELHPNKGGNEEKFKLLHAEYEKALKNKQTKGGRRTRKSKHNRSKTRKNRS